MDEPEIRDPMRSGGPGQYGWAADCIADILGTGADWAGGVGYALVLGAADWRRCGISRPVPASLLRALAEPHLGATGRAKLADQRTYETGLTWATSMTTRGGPLLQPTGPDAFSVDDYVIGLIWARGVTIPEDSWQVAIDNASGAELLRIGSMALAAYNQPEIAAQALRKAADYGDADEARTATGYLGVLLVQVGRITGARDAYQQARDSGQPAVAAGAVLILGDLLQEQGDIAGARDAYQQAIDSGQPDAAAQAAVQLGDLLKEQGDMAGATDAYQQAIDSGQPGAAAGAAVEPRGPA